MLISNRKSSVSPRFSSSHSHSCQVGKPWRCTTLPRFSSLNGSIDWVFTHRNLSAVFWNGGPQALASGILIVVAGALAQSASLAEMASIQPIAGAQYHWTHFLAPPQHRRFLTWMQGWLPSRVTKLYPMMLTT